MTKKTRTLIALATIMTLVVSLGAFGFFAFRSYHKTARFASAEAAYADGRRDEAKALLHQVINDDPNNERAVRLLAEIAKEEDNPPLEGWYRYLAMKLNPLDKSLIDPYLAAMVRMRNFDALAEFAEMDEEKQQARFTLPPEAAKLEEMIQKAEEHMGAKRYAEAQAIFTEATNINYYATAPMLARALLAQDRVPEATILYDDYLKKFSTLEIAYRQAELLALMLDRDRLGELAKRFPQTTPSAITFGNYVDCLRAFISGDIDTVSDIIPRVGKSVDTPFALLMMVAAELHLGEVAEAESAYRRLLSMEPFLDFRERARGMFRTDVARRFAAGEKAPDLVPEAKIVLEGGADFEIERLILLAKFQTRTLAMADLDAALAQHPDDPALLKLKAWQTEVEKSEAQAKQAEADAKKAAVEAAEAEIKRQREAAQEALREREEKAKEESAP